MGYADTAQFLLDLRPAKAKDPALTWVGETSDAVRCRMNRIDHQLSAPACVGVVDAIAPPGGARLSEMAKAASVHQGRFALVIDGMDRAGCEYVVFKSVLERCQSAGIFADLVIPVIASTGEGLSFVMDRIDWYQGPTLQQWLALLTEREYR